MDTTTTRVGFPRLPLDGKLDLTYRCNNACRHCWLWLPSDAVEGRDELTVDEIRRIVDEARSMGCQAWGISGGEPLLRPDFSEILDYITRKSMHYTLNTNGTLITPAIARLLTRKGRKMVALYGATAETHDFVTRSPGSFDATMRGMAYLKEAGAGFDVQVIPMRANYHQYAEMLALAETLSPHYRVGASWLHLSACGSTARNREIANQRLDPASAFALDVSETAMGSLSMLTENEDRAALCGTVGFGDDRLFASCIAGRRDFHIDPYGQMSFCPYIKDPALRYDLRSGTVEQAWDEFIPSLAGVVRGGKEYLDHCGSCTLKEDCKWCAVYGYLEHRRFSAKVDYLCRMAEETHRFKEQLRLSHQRYYQIAGITVRVSASFPLTDDTFAPKFAKFQVDGPGDDTISIRLVPAIPSLSAFKLGREVYRRPPWAIYRQKDAWVYVGISTDNSNQEPHAVAIFSADHSHGTIFRRPETFERGQLSSLTTFPTDQIVLAPALADRQACYFHAAGIVIDGKGLLFVGHSEAGKSTMIRLLRGQGEILCDERIIVRRWADGARIHGTWSHGELPDVSPSGAPLHAIMVLEKANVNEIIPIEGTRERLSQVLACVIKPLATADWWEKTLALAEKLTDEVPIYRLRFDMSGGIVDLLKRL